MSVYEYKGAVPLGAITTFRLTNLVEEAIKAFQAWRISRATVGSLQRLSDRELSDIGLPLRVGFTDQAGGFTLPVLHPAGG